MADGAGGQICIPINEKLEAISEKFPDSTITRVPDYLRNLNVEAYEPQMVAIGPFTYELRGKNHFKEMEERKMRYLKNLLEKRGEQNATSYFMAMKELEERARSCYSEPISLDSAAFVEMMLLDACFIVELLRKCMLERNQFDDNNDRVFKINWIQMTLGRDLLLADNQLPFFVLEDFYNKTKMPEEVENLYELILGFYNFVLGTKMPVPELGIPDSAKHHLLSFIYTNHPEKFPCTSEERENWNFIRCATELHEAGIEFKVVEEKDLFAIHFDEKKGIMQIPVLEIMDDTEFSFRNFIAYEQYSSSFTDNSPFINYIKFMDCLINTPKDVKLLCQSKILINFLGDDEVVAKMFNRLADHVYLPLYNYYGKIFNDVNIYCAEPCHEQMAKLRQNYFNTPWATISFFAALLLLILTVVQTVFSVLSYFQVPNAHRAPRIFQDQSAGWR